MSSSALDGRTHGIVNRRQSRLKTPVFRAHFEAAANADGHDPRCAPAEWLRAFVLSYPAQERAEVCAALRYIYSKYGRNFVLDEAEFEGDEAVHGAVSRVRVYFERKMSRHEERAYTRIIWAWENYALEHRFDPHEPSVQDLKRFFANYAESHRYKTVMAARTMVHRYLMTFGCDRAMSEELRLMLRGMQWAYRDADRPVGTLDQLRALLTYYEENRPLDIRDRLALLMVAFGVIGWLELVALCVGDITITESGVDVRVGDVVVPIGGLDEPALDIRGWARRWLEQLGPVDAAHPLFPQRAARGGFTNRPINEASIAYSFRRRTTRLGLDPRQLYLGFRRATAIEGCKRLGYVRTAHLLRLASLNALKRYDSSVRYAMSYVGTKPNGRRYRRRRP